MEELKKFCDLVESTDLKLISDLKKFLSENCPNWRKIVRDPNNWDKIEKLQPTCKFESFCEMILEEAGIDLIVRWLSSSDNRLREYAAKEFLDKVESYNHLSILNPQLWGKLPDDAKELVICEMFKEWEERLKNLRIYCRIYWKT